MLSMACLYILVWTAIQVNKIPVPSDMIWHFYIAELITQMAKVWKQFILHLAACEHVFENNNVCFCQLFYDF